MQMVQPTDGMVIIEDTVFAPGIYHLPNGIAIGSDNVTIDGSGALLIGSERQGRGLTMEARAGVSVKNLRLQGYYHGIWAHRCERLTIEGCQVRDTAEVDANTIFLDIWLPAEKAYGGGIFLWEVVDSRILENDLQHQMNGLLTYQCRHLRVERNLANYSSGYGIHLYDTCDSEFIENYVDFCCRYHPRGERYGHMGADATGFLVVYGSSRNQFLRNLARMGGDGFFLAGLSPDGELRGCDDNLFEGNDGSYSPNIAFEATFCRGNLFRDNFANYCNYGFWLGFSRDNVIENNRMIHNRQAGIAVENGIGFTVKGNTFQACGHGVLLWSKRVPDFDTAVPDNDTSREWEIVENVLIRCGKAVRIAAQQDHGIRDLPPEAEQAPRPHHHTIRKNEIQEGRIGIDLVKADHTVIEENLMNHNVEANLRQDDAQETQFRFNVGAAGGYL